MKKLNEKVWKRFSMNDVFNIGHGFYNKKPPMSPDGTVPFVGASGINNGITGFCTMQAVRDNSKVGYGPNEPIERKLFNRNSICVVNNGSAIGYSYYQPKQFTCTHDVNPLTMRDHEASEDEALFLSQMIREQGVCFIYARKWRPSRMVRSQFLLPVDDDGKPDYGYMAQYVSEIKESMLIRYRDYVAEQLSQLEFKDIPALSEKEWKDVELGQIADISSGCDIYAQERIRGDTPYITSGTANNGIGYFVGNNNDSKAKNTISVNRNGAVGEAFYHPYEALYGNDCRRVNLHDADDKATQLFVAQCISKQKKTFSYSRKLGTARLKRLHIMLPVDDNGEPDYAYMAQYAKNMMYRKYKQYLCFCRSRKNGDIDA